MQPEPGSAADWLRHARSDLALARHTPDDWILFEALCFHAQQTAEKALKALMISRGMEIPRTHNLAVLMDLLSESLVIPEEIRACAALTDYAVTTRYPGGFEDVDAAEHRIALDLAERTLVWAAKQAGIGSDSLE